MSKGNIILKNIQSVTIPVRGWYLLQDVQNGTEVSVHLEARGYTRDELFKLHGLETIFYKYFVEFHQNLRI
jgi:hypothetical protein